jgi:SAM-dependent methyltransferase
MRGKITKMGTALYDSFIAEYYDASPVVAGRAQDISFYRSAAREFGDPILELGCGTGRVTLALAAEGYRVTGLDVSERMLAQAESKRANLPREAQERIHLVQGDMAGFELGEKFRCILIPFRPFQHLLETHQQINCLIRARKHLKRGGKLIVDFFQTDPRRMHDPAFLEERYVGEFALPDGRHAVLTERATAFHRASQCNDVEMIYAVRHPDGRKERLVFAFTVRYFFRYEVEHLLARCGFVVNAVYGDFDRSELRDDSPEMIFVASAG